MINSVPSLSRKNRPLIVFGEDWGAHPSSTQHIVKVLGKTRPVIWLNSIGLRKPKLTLHDLLRLFNKAKSFIVNKPKSIKEGNMAKEDINSNFIVISPLVIPCANSWFSLKLSKIILKWQLKSACKKLAIEDPIIWTSLPTSVDYLELFGKRPAYIIAEMILIALMVLITNLLHKRRERLLKNRAIFLQPVKKCWINFQVRKR